VTAWYKRAADYAQGTRIRCAFVSTNGITQGEQPAVLWKPLAERGVSINFGIPTFKWSNEAKGKAAVVVEHIKAKHAIQDYVFTDGFATESIERRFAEDLDVADEVVVYAK
jgi:hypothetical protein